jgi:hypothetical protein
LDETNYRQVFLDFKPGKMKTTMESTEGFVGEKNKKQKKEKHKTT